VQILANALPGFRDLRAPVIAGYMWLVFAWLLVDPNLNHRPGDRIGAAIFDLGHRVGHVGIAIAVSVVAYLLGAVSQAVPATISTTLKEVIERRRGISQDPEFDQYRRRSLYYVANPAGQEIDELASELVGVIANTPHLPSELRKELDRRHARARAEADKELTLPATLLVGKEPELFAEVDRLRAEGELRLSIIPPLIALLAVATALGSSWWLLGAPFALILLNDGARRNQNSRRLIADAISRKAIKSPSVERFRDQITNLRESINEVHGRRPPVS
jgi:hypothetical protein